MGRGGKRVSASLLLKNYCFANFCRAAEVEDEVVLVVETVEIDQILEPTKRHCLEQMTSSRDTTMSSELCQRTSAKLSGRP